MVEIAARQSDPFFPGPVYRPRHAGLSDSGAQGAGPEDPRRPPAHHDLADRVGKGCHLRPQRGKARRQRHGGFGLRRSLQGCGSPDNSREDRSHSAHRPGNDPEKIIRIPELLLDRPQDYAGPGRSGRKSGPGRHLPHQGAQTLLSQRRAGGPSDRLCRTGRQGAGGGGTEI